MNKIRINELAAELKIKAHEIIDRLPELGVTEKKTHSSSIDEDVAIKLRGIFRRQDVAGAGKVPAPAVEASHSIGSLNKVRINELAHELEVKAHEIIDRLPELGVTEKKTHSSSIDEDVAIKLRRMFGRQVNEQDLVGADAVPAHSIRPPVLVPGAPSGPHVGITAAAPPTSAQQLNRALPQPERALLSASQVSDLRRRLVQFLARLDPTVTRPPEESVGTRISRLSYAGLIPREIAATMRMVTEMRNATEYESKSLSNAQSAAVEASWAAIEEWAASRRLNI